MLCVCFLRFILGPAENCTERAGTVGERAYADEHECDDALLQQPHDVLSDQHEVSAGCKPKPDRQRVQPRGTTTVRDKYVSCHEIMKFSHSKTQATLAVWQTLWKVTNMQSIL